MMSSVDMETSNSTSITALCTMYVYAITVYIECVLCICIYTCYKKTLVFSIVTPALRKLSVLLKGKITHWL